MKIPWNLVLPEKTLQSELNRRLTRQQRPFIILLITLSSLCTLALLARANMSELWTKPQKFINENLYIAVFLIVIIMLFFVLWVPKLTTIIILMCRTGLCVFIVYGNMVRFEDKCADESEEGRLKYEIDAYRVRIDTIFAYINLSIFFTPFSDSYFTSFTLISTFFTVELLSINRYQDQTKAQS